MQKKISLIILGVVLVGAFFLRVYRIDKVLGFYFDQGRDALVIWNLIHLHKFFLIGPTTGLPGIFRGPYYYYLIAPFYWLGKGNPVWPTVFLALTTVAAIVLVYLLAAKISDKSTGIIAAIIAGFSFNVVIASRWLSNPTPMLLLSTLIVLSMTKITQNTKQKAQIWWAILSGVFGLSLFSFGSSGEFFYFPALVIFAIWQRRKLPTLKYLLISAFVFFVTFAPLMLFDFKHQHILLNNFLGTFGGGSGSFKFPTLEFFNSRNVSYFDIFINKIFQDRGKTENIILIIIGIVSLVSLSKLVKRPGIKILFLLLGSAVVGLYFYQGNYGVLYDYYMTGYYLIFVLLFGIILGVIWKYKLGKLFVVYFFYLFFMNNLPVTISKISDGCDGPESICFMNQKQAIGWIYKDAKDAKFNVDEYVPPVIPYAYNYLLEWYPTTPRLRGADSEQVQDQVPLLYTLYEIDPPHPERLNAWLLRQKGIGKVISTYKTGGITVERRERIIKK